MKMELKKLPRNNLLKYAKQMKTSWTFYKILVKIGLTRFNRSIEIDRNHFISALI